LVGVRLETPDDIAPIRAVHLASFPTSTEARLVDLLRTAGHLTVSLVADAGGEIVGHAAFSPVSAASGSPGLGLAPVAVLPAHRHQGVAARMIEQGIDTSAALGFGWLVVLGDPDYYGRFRFRPASSAGLVDEYGGGDAFQVLEIIPGSLPRGAGLVLYSPEFASLE
jgi:putative acetyltransferase